MRNKLIDVILSKARVVADSETCVVIIGEFGSGKSWLARKIHNFSERKDRPFLQVDCNTIRQKDARGDLFGVLSYSDEIGARINKGALERSNEGTLFLRDFDALSEDLQQTLLKTIRTNELFHHGSRRAIPIDVRVILSIDVNVFYYSVSRYNLIKSDLESNHDIIFHPPLRQRRDEISQLIENFLQEDFSSRYNLDSLEISPKTVYQCIRYDWPGNVKQLKNAVEHAVVLSAGSRIRPEHLPATVREGQPGKRELRLLENDANYKTAERKLLGKLFREAGSAEDVARLVEMEESTISRKIKRYEIMNQESDNR